MSNIVNKLYQNNTIIYKVILFLVATIAIVYLFPKVGQFKYDFSNGQPWKYDNLSAPFDFAVQKTDEEIKIEKKEIEVNAKEYFLYNSEVVSDVNSNYKRRISSLKISDSLSINEINTLKEIGQKVIDEVYKTGFLEVVSQGRISNKNEIIAIRKGNEVENFSYKKLYYSKEVLNLVKSNLGNKSY